MYRDDESGSASQMSANIAGMTTQAITTTWIHSLGVGSRCLSS